MHFWFALCPIPLHPNEPHRLGGQQPPCAAHWLFPLDLGRDSELLRLTSKWYSALKMTEECRLSIQYTQDSFLGRVGLVVLNSAKWKYYLTHPLGVVESCCRSLGKLLFMHSFHTWFWLSPRHLCSIWKKINMIQFGHYFKGSKHQAE